MSSLSYNCFAVTGNQAKGLAGRKFWCVPPRFTGQIEQKDRRPEQDRFRSGRWAQTSPFLGTKRVWGRTSAQRLPLKATKESKNITNLWSEHFKSLRLDPYLQVDSQEQALSTELGLVLRWSGRCLLPCSLVAGKQLCYNIRWVSGSETVRFSSSHPTPVIFIVCSHSEHCGKSCLMYLDFYIHFFLIHFYNTFFNDSFHFVFQLPTLHQYYTPPSTHLTAPSINPTSVQWADEPQDFCTGHCTMFL